VAPGEGPQSAYVCLTGRLRYFEPSDYVENIESKEPHNRILQFLTDRDEASTDEVALHVGGDVQTLADALDDLEDWRLIRCFHLPIPQPEM
jgi:hypothetical protein